MFGMGEPQAGVTSDWTDPFFKFRYGVTGPEKDQMMYSGNFPGSVPYTQNPQASERAASAYLFGRNWPSIAEPATNAINSVYGFFGQDPSVTEAAKRAVSYGVSNQDPSNMVGMGGYFNQ